MTERYNTPNALASREAGFRLSLHPDTITTKDIIDAIKTDGLLNFFSWKELDSQQTAGSDSIPIFYTGEVLFRCDDKITPLTIVAQNNRLLTPESLRFARDAYLRAEAQKMDLWLIVNTEGGAAGTSAALMGQSSLVSDNIMTLLNLKTNIVSLILRKGGSGGALSNQVSDVALMMEYAHYYVISPPHCSSILWKSNDRIAEAVNLMQSSAADLLQAGIIDKVIKEYPGGAHLERAQGYKQTLLNINDALVRTLLEFRKRHKSIPFKLRPTHLRHQRAFGYVKELPVTILAGKLITSKLKRVITVADITKTKGIVPKRVTDLVAGQDMLQAYLMLEKFKVMAEQSGFKDQEAVRCGHEGDVRVANPGLIVPVDTIRLGKLRYQLRIGEISFIQYTQRVRKALLETKEPQECNAVIPFRAFLNNHYSCPECGWGPALPAHDWIKLFCDHNTPFKEINSYFDLTLLRPTIYHTESYLNLVRSKQRELGIYSALVTGEGSMYGQPVTFAAMDFYFLGGTLSMDVAVKFKKAAEYARKHKQPLVMISSTGGARMQEGVLALKMMEMTMAVVSKMKGEVPYFVVLTNPTFGGTPASFGGQGIVTIAELGLRYGFAGPRVVELAKGEIQNYAMHPLVLEQVETAPGRPIINYVGLRNQLKDLIFPLIVAAQARR